MVALGIYDGSSEEDPLGLATILRALESVASPCLWSADLECAGVNEVPKDLEERARASVFRDGLSYDDILAVARVFYDIHDATFESDPKDLLIESYGRPGTPWEIRCADELADTVRRLLADANVKWVKEIPEV